MPLRWRTPLGPTFALTWPMCGAELARDHWFWWQLITGARFVIATGETLNSDPAAASSSGRVRAGQSPRRCCTA